MLASLERLQQQQQQLQQQRQPGPAAHPQPQHGADPARPASAADSGSMRNTSSSAGSSAGSDAGARSASAGAGGGAARPASRAGPSLLPPDGMGGAGAAAAQRAAKLSPTQLAARLTLVPPAAPVATFKRPHAEQVGAGAKEHSPVGLRSRHGAAFGHSPA
jgi:hypothetical protein